MTTTGKYSFFNDYSELAHPEVLAALSELGSTQFTGYGLDEFSEAAREIIVEKIALPDAEVHFTSGGTQANLIVVASALRPYEAVIATDYGHINTHETGAIEATGHKVCVTPHVHGKLDVAGIEALVTYQSDEHMVKPRMVYISQSTELGTVYTAAELTAISRYCRANSLYLYADGARLGAAMNSDACDLSYAQFAKLVDAFYIGGTKNGALFGEAIVIVNDELKADFRYNLKLRGALLAKGAALGLQFKALLGSRKGSDVYAVSVGSSGGSSGGSGSGSSSSFTTTSTLYDELAEHANLMAARLAKGIAALGYEFLSPVETNQVFPIFPTQTATKLHDLYGFYDWSESEAGTAVRLVTSWVTPEAMVDEFLADLAKLSY